MWEIILEKYHELQWPVFTGLIFGYVVVDGLYAYYTLAVARHNAAVSAHTSAILHILLAVGVLSYVENFLYIIPIAIGSWVGTYLVVQREAKAGKR
ncbi:MAG: hypothetical protein H6780_03475 [Candidatus Nomurabacteria bacterium]|nr:MAG: hypothetical protein H6780_03475 [Candidatus Nomurabacteria bacterium]